VNYPFKWGMPLQSSALENSECLHDW